MRQIHRRTLLALPAMLLAGRALAAPAAPWLAYERLLRGRLSDEGGGGFDQDFETDLLDLTNLFRGQQGRPPLGWDDGLARAARAHAADMAARNSFEHLTPEGYGPAARVGLLARDLVGAVGENIAMRRNARAPATPQQIMQQWRDSPGHRANMLTPGFTHAGLGLVRLNGEVVAVAVYAEVSARLARPAPLRVAGVEAIAEALAEATPPISQFSVSEPGGEALTTTYVEGRAVTLTPGAWQSRPHLASGPRRYQVAWGPVFVLG
jgi:uncharacterized protein YkwD